MPLDLALYMLAFAFQPALSHAPHAHRCDMIAYCGMDPCSFVPSTCPSPMPPNITCYDNYCGPAVSTRSGRPVEICGAVWVDDAADIEQCGNYRKEPYTRPEYDGYYSAEVQAKPAAEHEAIVIDYDHDYVGPAVSKTAGPRRSVWVWAGAAGGLVLVVVVGLAVVYTRDGRHLTQPKHLAMWA